MAEERNDSSHQPESDECDLNENMFITPKVLVNNIYSHSEPESEEERDEPDAPEDSEKDKELEGTGDEDSDFPDSLENESSTSKRIRLSRSPKKLAKSLTPSNRPSNLQPTRLISSDSVSVKKRTFAKEKSKSVDHTPSRTLHTHPRKMQANNREVSDKSSGPDDLTKISSLLTQVLQRLERTEAKLESVEHKLESSSSLSSSSCSEKKREVPQIVKVNF